MIPDPIDALFCDVDGVLTAGGLSMSGDGLRKTFHVRDGRGLVRLAEVGLLVALVTGRDDAAASARAVELGLPLHVARDAGDKARIVGDLLKAAHLSAERAVFLGDDEPDLVAMAAVGWPVAVADADVSVRRIARRVTRACGGQGAVREVADWILERRMDR